MFRFDDNQPHKIPQFIASGTALAIGAGTAAVSAAGKIASGMAQAKAVGEAGKAELAARKGALAQQVEERKRIEARADLAAVPSIEELQAVNRLIQENDRALNTAFSAVESEIATLEESTDPGIRAAGENITELLMGRASAALGPVKKQRERQKQELQNQLRAKLGPGFRTSTAGIQALQGFDDQTELLMADVQEKALTSATQTLGTLAGARRSAVSGATQFAGTAAQARAAEVSAQQNIANRRANAATAGLEQKIDFGQVAEAAGAPFGGDIARAQTFGQAFQDVGQVGGTLFGLGLGKSEGLKGKDLLSTASKFGDVVSSFSIGNTGGGGNSKVRTAG